MNPVVQLHGRTAAPNVLPGGDLLRSSTLSAGEQAALLELAARMRDEPDGFQLPGRGSVACLFEKPSTRTRVSLQTAAHHLGLLPIVLSPSELQLGRGEPLEDTARVLAGYCSAIVARVKSHETVERLAAASDVPVVNSLSDLHHPLQALADLLTLKDRFGELAGLTVAFLGDANANVAHSLIEASGLAGMHVVVGSPAGYGPAADVLAAAREAAAQSGGSVEVVHDPRQAVRDADAVVTDVWVSMGQEAERRHRVLDLEPYRVDGALMRSAAPHAVFLHCLPAHRGEEVTAEVIDGPQSAVFEEARNRQPTAQAVLYSVISNQGRGT
jgi:ornithine carbamoyltransferase